MARRLDEPLHIAFAAAPPTMVGEESGEHRRALEEIGGGLLPRRSPPPGAGVQVEAHLAPERPVDLLLGLADDHDVRMIVVGTYGEHPLRGRDPRLDAAQAAAPQQPPRARGAGALTRVGCGAEDRTSVSASQHRY